jgi:hypothetical protein
MAIFGAILTPCLTTLVGIVWPNFTLVGQVKADKKSGGGGELFALQKKWVFVLAGAKQLRSNIFPPISPPIVNFI